MKQLKKSLLIHIWEEYEFYLHIPQSFDGSNKPFIFYYYFDGKSNKSVRIRKYLNKNNGDTRKIKAEAKETIVEVVELLAADWNPITGHINPVELKPHANIVTCIDTWLTAKEKDYSNQSIGQKRLKGLRIIMMHFKSYLTHENQLHLKASTITNVHIKDFLDSKAFERKWSKVSYNTYRVDMGTFFEYLVDLKVIKDNPVIKVPGKVTKYDSSRFKVFETEELTAVAELLANDKAFLGLHLAAQLVFRYNIRPLEITKIQVRNIDFTKGILVLDAYKTKNRNEATFKIDDGMLIALNDLIDSADPEYFVFGGWNKPSANQTCVDYFGQRWRIFRKKYELPTHLKFYALKHSSNYYDIESGAVYEEIRQRNRHANLQITTLYIRERLFKNVIKPSESKLF